MKINFIKYQGTGNDFIMIDNRNLSFPKENSELVAHLCNRHFGIGADGLILLENNNLNNFSMVYYNSDGHESTMCGNGGRCVVAFAKTLYPEHEYFRFMAIDGEHSAEVKEINGNRTIVSLKMNDVDEIETIDNDYFLNTGSPHFVTFVKDIDSIDVDYEGKKIRYSERFAGKGTNVDFLERFEDYIYVRTYERGVENETLSCGTGVVASAIVTDFSRSVNKSVYKIRTLGGELSVKFNSSDKKKYTDIWLEGPATMVFMGNYEF
ncbi:MAG: diaminopimelate epimerase [Bacteroidota bacterium]|nr:diaminopimelate epimerase [Bacteroidota bacterium]